MDAALIGLDWGTTSFRGYRLAAEAILARLAADEIVPEAP